MLRWLSLWAADRRKARELYGAVVTQARQPMFFDGLGVPDTPEGRYETIVLHLFLVLERLRAEGSPGQNLSRRLIEAFVTDMDDSMREMGVGDLTVPKRVKRAAAGFYERSGEYRTALAYPATSVLEQALARRVLARNDNDAATAAGAPTADLLAAYVRGAATALAAQDGCALLDGHVTFPPVVYVEM